MVSRIISMNKKRLNFDNFYPKNIQRIKETGTQEEKDLIKEINVLVRGVCEGNYCYKHNSVLYGDEPPIPERSWKREYLRQAIKGCKRGLEIGFNAGHSAAIMLCTEPQLHLSAIDIGRYSYTKRCALLFTAHFKDRFQFIMRSSQNILPVSTGQCDFVHIDGGHDDKEVMMDLEWACDNTIQGGKILIDDAYFFHIKRLYVDKINKGILKLAETKMKSSQENILLEKI